jgi:hypothetical protein
MHRRGVSADGEPGVRVAHVIYSAAINAPCTAELPQGLARASLRPQGSVEAAKPKVALGTTLGTAKTRLHKHPRSLLGLGNTMVEPRGRGFTKENKTIARRS